MTRRDRRIPAPALLLGGLCLWTLVPALTLLGGHGVFNGTYGIDVPDLMQYMGFIRDAGQHGLISNQFNVVPDKRLFLDPVFALSGLVWRLGASIQLAQLLWIPVSVATLFVAFRAYAQRLLGDPRRVALALLLAFFYLAPATALADWLHWSPTLRFGTQVVGLEMFAGAYGWGGGPLIATALVPLALLAAERAVDPRRRRIGRSGLRYAAWAGVAGLLAAWLHPWQGLTLLVILIGLAAWGRLERRFAWLLIPAALTAAPLVYFEVLSHVHSSWMLVSRPNDYSHFGWWLLLGLAPAGVALIGVPARHLDVQERALRLWPLAAAVVYLGLNRTWFYHAFAGLSLPLAILTVKGWGRLRVPNSVTALALTVAIVPGLVWFVQQLVRTRSQHFFASGEAQALRFLDRARPNGPVLAPAMPVGQAVPAFSGRQTFVGHYYWTPEYALRADLAERLFDGRLSRSTAVGLVRSSRARFLVSDCRPGRVDLSGVLHGMLAAEHHFGCATVYRVRQG